ncbi:hypothetical protein EON81_10065 [bacterium]|nr:MAG: hypothetical protein EON81_10065 [bacterium]
MKKTTLLFALLAAISAVAVTGCGGSSAPYSQSTGSTDQISFNLGGGGSATTQPGEPVTYDVTLSQIKNPGSNTTAVLSVSGLPEGVTGTFAPTPTPISEGSANASLSLTVPSSIQDGTYPFTIGARIGSANRTIAATLVVNDGLVVQVSGGGTSTVAAGTTATFPITAKLVQSSQGGQTRGPNDVELSTVGLPNGATPSFSVNPLRATQAGAESILSVAVPLSIPAGEYPFTIVAKVEGVPQNFVATLIVESANVFDFSVTGPSWFRADVGDPVEYDGNVTTLEGISGESTVNMSISGLPAGSEFVINPNPVSPSGEGSLFTISITTSPSALPGRYPLTITGTSGNITRTRNTALFLYAPDQEL